MAASTCAWVAAALYAAVVIWTYVGIWIDRHHVDPECPPLGDRSIPDPPVPGGILVDLALAVIAPIVWVPIAAALGLDRLRRMVVTRRVTGVATRLDRRSAGEASS